MRILLVGTYFLCLTPPASQLLLTVRKQMHALFISVPGVALGFGAALIGSRYGLSGVAIGVSLVFFAEFVAVNAYAFSHFCGARDIVVLIGRITLTAAVLVLVALAVESFVPAGPPLVAWFGGWRVLVISLAVLPLLVRSARRIRAIQIPDSVDIAGGGH